MFLIAARIVVGQQLTTTHVRLSVCVYVRVIVSVANARQGDGNTLDRPSVRESALRTVILTTYRLTATTSHTREPVN